MATIGSGMPTAQANTVQFICPKREGEGEEDEEEVRIFFMRERSIRRANPSGIEFVDTSYGFFSETKPHCMVQDQTTMTLPITSMMSDHSSLVAVK